MTIEINALIEGRKYQITEKNREFTVLDIQGNDYGRHENFEGKVRIVKLLDRSLGGKHKGFMRVLNLELNCEQLLHIDSQLSAKELH